MDKYAVNAATSLVFAGAARWHAGSILSGSTPVALLGGSGTAVCCAELGQLGTASPQNCSPRPDQTCKPNKITAQDFHAGRRSQLLANAPRRISLLV